MNSSQSRWSNVFLRLFFSFIHWMAYRWILISGQIMSFHLVLCALFIRTHKFRFVYILLLTLCNSIFIHLSVCSLPQIDIVRWCLNVNLLKCKLHLQHSDFAHIYSCASFVWRELRLLYQLNFNSFVKSIFMFGNGSHVNKYLSVCVPNRWKKMQDSLQSKKKRIQNFALIAFFAVTFDYFLLCANECLVLAYLSMSYDLFIFQIILFELKTKSDRKRYQMNILSLSLSLCCVVFWMKLHSMHKSSNASICMDHLLNFNYTIKVLYK